MKNSLLFSILFITLLSCNTENEPKVENNTIAENAAVVQEEYYQSEDTKEMVKLLDDILVNVIPEENLYRNTQRANILKSRLQSGQAPAYGVVWFDYCTELLRSGNTQECINELNSYFDPSLPLAQQITSNDAVLTIELLALAHLRLGEQQNCQNAHTAFSCILPLKEPGIHQLRSGSEKAIELYQMMYDNAPKSNYKWLINLAYMTLGEHPAGVPEKYLIPFPNWNFETKEFPRFEEIAMNVNVAHNGLSGGTSVEDFNNDGLIDIFVTAYGIEEQCRLFINNGKGSYDDKTFEAGLKGINGGLNCIHADYNNDGFKDIFVLRGAWLGDHGKHPNSLLKNNGDGTFSDVTKAAGLLTYFATQTATWADFNKDGYLDLFVGNESTVGTSIPSQLFKNNGDGTFAEVSNSVGLGDVITFVKGVTWGDINNDGWPDLLISDYLGQNQLYKNNKGQFENISQKSGIEGPISSFPCWFFDVNNDGFQDIFIAGYEQGERDITTKVYADDLEEIETTISHPALYINNGNETFTNKTKQYNLSQAMFSMGCNYGDLDNDGYLDFYLGTGSPDFSAVYPNRMFRNVAGKKFEEVTSAGGFGHIQKGHGVAFADLDNDGDEDVYAVMGGAYEADAFTNVLFENPGFGNNWIIIELEGTTTNRDGIGSRLELTLDNGRKIYRVVSTGGSFGASSLQQEIGLAKAERVKRLKIYWQNGATQVLTDLPVNQKIKIVEGGVEAKTISYNYVPFSKGDGMGHKHH